MFKSPEAEGKTREKSLKEPRFQRKLHSYRLQLRPHCMKSKRWVVPFFTFYWNLWIDTATTADDNNSANDGDDDDNSAFVEFPSQAKLSQEVSVPFFSHAVSFLHIWHFLSLHFIFNQSGNETCSMLVWLLLSFSAVVQAPHIHPDSSRGKFPIPGFDTSSLRLLLWGTVCALHQGGYLSLLPVRGFAISWKSFHDGVAAKPFFLSIQSCS